MAHRNIIHGTFDFEAEMFQRQSAIPEEERCPQCGGKGYRKRGCAVICTNYEPCFSCQETGKNLLQQMERQIEKELASNKQ